MRLAQKLLGYLNRVFKKDPERFLALRLSYDGGMSWSIEDAVLRTVVTGGSGSNLEVDLKAYTINTLVAFLSAQPGYSIPYIDSTELSTLGARVLMDGAGNIGQSNGDHLYGYESVLMAYVEAVAFELRAAGLQIVQMLRQMSTKTAEGMWLDEIGGYYGVPRLRNESDAAYGPRIITEVLRPRGNNVAMEIAIRDFTGQVATVTNVVLFGDTFPLYNGAIQHVGDPYYYNADSAPIYGLFDVQYGYDLLNGGDIGDFTDQVRDLIGRLRDAGTHLRALNLTGSAIEDTFVAPTESYRMALAMAVDETLTAPTDSQPTMALKAAEVIETLPTPTEDASLTINYGITYSGLRLYDGTVRHNGGQSATAPL